MSCSIYGFAKQCVILGSYLTPSSASSRNMLRHINLCWKPWHVSKLLASRWTARQDAEQCLTSFSWKYEHIPRQGLSIQSRSVVRTIMSTRNQRVSQNNCAPNRIVSHRARCFARPNRYVANMRQSFIILPRLSLPWGTSRTKRALVLVQYRYATFIARDTWWWQGGADLSKSEVAPSSTSNSRALIKSSKLFNFRSIGRFNFKIITALDRQNLEVMLTIVCDSKSKILKLLAASFRLKLQATTY